MDELKLCPNCLRSVKRHERFCKFCGYPLKYDPNISERRLGIPIPDQVINQLDIRLNLENIKEKKKNLQLQLKEIEKEFELRVKPLSEIEKQIDELKDKLEKIAGEEENFKSIIEPLPIEKLVKKKECFEDELKNLDMRLEAGEIEEDAYYSLHETLKLKIQNIKSQIKDELERFKTWISMLNSRVKTFEIRLNDALLKYESGILSESEYKNIIPTLNKEINKYKNYLRILKSEYKRIKARALI
ncbi:MAG: hypothetical protein ACTSSJ_01490 [Candidatus Odinarchaeia archaeon]